MAEQVPLTAYSPLFVQDVKTGEPSYPVAHAPCTENAPLLRSRLASTGTAKPIGMGGRVHTIGLQHASLSAATAILHAAPTHRTDAALSSYSKPVSKVVQSSSETVAVPGSSPFLSSHVARSFRPTETVIFISCSPSPSEAATSAKGSLLSEKNVATPMAP